MITIDITLITKDITLQEIPNLSSEIFFMLLHAIALKEESVFGQIKLSAPHY